VIRQPRYDQDPSRYYVPCAYQALTVDGTVRSPAVPNPQIRGARVWFTAGPIRLTLDGTVPVGGSVGVPLWDGKEDTFDRPELDGMKLIREGATNGTVHFIYYR
jgi:hypothetical protein